MRGVRRGTHEILVFCARVDRHEEQIGSSCSLSVGIAPYPRGAFTLDLGVETLSRQLTIIWGDDRKSTRHTACRHGVRPRPRRAGRRPLHPSRRRRASWRGCADEIGLVRDPRASPRSLAEFCRGSADSGRLPPPVEAVEERQKLVVSPDGRNPYVTSLDRGLAVFGRQPRLST